MATRVERVERWEKSGLSKLISVGATILKGLGQFEEDANAIVAHAGPVVEHMAASEILESTPDRRTTRCGLTSLGSA